MRAPRKSAVAAVASVCLLSFVTPAMASATDVKPTPVLPKAADEPSNVTVKADCEIQLQEPLPAPAPKPDGRGAAMDGQQPDYARSYAADPYLQKEVQQYRRWQWKDMYTSLDDKAKERPDYLDTYRLQADAYQVNSTYGEALAQLDQLLRRNPNDVHALASTSLIQYYLGNRPDYRCRMAHLKKVSPGAANDMKAFIRFAENTMYATYGSQPQTNVTPEAIAVFGQSPNDDGTPTAGLLTRLNKAKEMADRFPNAWIVVSGAAVRTQYSEAEVMEKWLVEQGVNPGRIVKDDRARDTVGNAMGMVRIFQQYGIHNVLLVGTISHLPRATTTTKALADRYGWKLNIDTAGGGERPNPASQVGERQYTYVTAARAAGLYEKADFAKYSTK